MPDRRRFDWQPWAFYVLGVPLMLALLLSPVGVLLLWAGVMVWFWGYGLRRALRWWRVPAPRRRAIRHRQRLAAETHRALIEAVTQARLAQQGLIDTPANRIAVLGRRGRR